MVMECCVIVSDLGQDFKQMVQVFFLFGLFYLWVLLCCFCWCRWYLCCFVCGFLFFVFFYGVRFGQFIWIGVGCGSLWQLRCGGVVFMLLFGEDIGGVGVVLWNLVFVVVVVLIDIGFWGFGCQCLGSSCCCCGLGIMNSSSVNIIYVSCKWWKLVQKIVKLILVEGIKLNFFKWYRD